MMYRDGQLENDPQVDRCSLRGKIWKALIGVGEVDAEYYISLVKSGQCKVYSKIRCDTPRTLKTNAKFHERVPESTLIRVLNSTCNHMQSKEINNRVSYVQGMNILLSPLLYVMPEVDAFYTFICLIENHYPRYVEASMSGVIDGCALLEECMEICDLDLYKHLMLQNDGGRVFHFRSVMTLCCCTPPVSYTHLRAHET